MGIFFLVATSPGRSLATDIASPVLHHSSVHGGSFLQGVLSDIGARQTRANLDSLEAWLPHENTKAKNNPMATTRSEPGATLLKNNPDGVRNYPTAAEGERATAATLEDGRYPGILTALRAGSGLCNRPDLAGEFLTWSGGGYDSIC